MCEPLTQKLSHVSLKGKNFSEEANAAAAEVREVELRITESVELNKEVGKYQKAQIGTKPNCVNFIKTYCRE